MKVLIILSTVVIIFCASGCATTSKMPQTRLAGSYTITGFDSVCTLVLKPNGSYTESFFDGGGMYREDRGSGRWQEDQGVVTLIPNSGAKRKLLVTEEQKNGRDYLVLSEKRLVYRKLLEDRG